MGKWWSVGAGRRAKRGLFSKEKILKRETWENDFFGGDFNLVIIRRERERESWRIAQEGEEGDFDMRVSAGMFFYIISF